MGTLLREIRKTDLEQIMRWRMDPEITKYMYTNPVLDMEKQLAWYDHIQSSPTVRYWLIEQNGEPAGVINLADIHWDEKNCMWGYYVGERRLRSLKLAVSVEMSLYDYVFDVLGFEEIRSEVLSINERVIQLHLACGCHITKVVQGGVIKEGQAYDITYLSITKQEWDQIRGKKKYEKLNYNIECYKNG